jgi:hypothetical protein
MSQTRKQVCFHGKNWREVKKIEEEMKMKNASSEEIYIATRDKLYKCIVPGCKNFYCEVCDVADKTCFLHWGFR